MDALVVGRTLEHDRPEQLAGDGARQLVGSELVDDPELLVRDEQEQAEQLRLDRRDRPQDVVDRQRVGRGQDRVGGDPRLAAPLCPDRRSLRDRVPRRSLEDLAQDALLDARRATDLAERLVATKRVGDLRGSRA